MTALTDFLFVKETAKVIDLPLFNTYVGGISGHGKTEFIKSFVLKLHEEHPDMKILIVDSTDDQEYRELGQPVPLCLVDTTEPFVLKELLTSVSGIMMERYIAQIIDEISMSKTLAEACTQMETKINLAKKAGRDRKNENWLHPVERQRILVVATALRKLLDLADKMRVSDKLTLTPGINRMNLSLRGVDANLKLGFQQLIVRSVAFKILNEYKDTFLVLDEGQKWCPQRYGSVAKQAISDLLGEGRKKGDLSLIASQSQVKFDKEPLYNVRYYVMGLQTRPEEVKRTIEVLDDVLESVSLTKRDVKTLEDGWFWILTKRTVQKAYCKPTIMTTELAIQVAQHKISAADAWELALAEKMKRDTVSQVDAYKKLMPTAPAEVGSEVEINSLKEEVASLKGKVQTLTTALEMVRERFSKRSIVSDKSDVAVVDVEQIRRLVHEAITTFHPEGASVPIPSEIILKETTPNLTILRDSSPVEVDESTLRGRILTAALEDGYFDTPKTAADVAIFGGKNKWPGSGNAPRELEYFADRHILKRNWRGKKHGKGTIAEYTLMPEARSKIKIKETGVNDEPI